MSCYLNLLKIGPSTRQLHRNFRFFSLIHQNNANAISRKNSSNLILKRFKSNSSLSNKAADEAKVQKVKLKVSDLRRLLSLAKTEKWKISGLNDAFQEFNKFHSKLNYFSCNWMSRNFIIDHDGRSVRVRQNT